MNSGPFVLGVDLDGVCADFYGGLRPLAAEWLDVPLDSLSGEVTVGLHEWGIDAAAGGYEAFHRFAVTQRDLFLTLKPLPGVGPALRRLAYENHVRIRIITQRLILKYFHKMAVRQTVEWLDAHDIPYWDLCFMGDKSAVGADLYVEDDPTNVARLIAEGQRVIVFSSSTNRTVSGLRVGSWAEAEELVLRIAAEVAPCQVRQVVKGDTIGDVDLPGRR